MRGEHQTLHLFCKVVDNYGDIGVCWRLARQIAHEHALTVTLWVDDLVSFHRICDEVNVHAPLQTVQGVIVRHWVAHGWDHVAPENVGNIVIEGFGCALPPAYIQAMAQAVPKPVWFNLEYLSAEPWVEDCHAMASHHPSLPLTKYFFFPGFTTKTGGLLMDQRTMARQALFDATPDAATNFFKQQGIPVVAGAHTISLFCYPHAPVADLLAALVRSTAPVVLLVPEGVAKEAITAFCGQEMTAGQTFTQGGLTVHVLAYTDQATFDTLLWSCDVNFIRGEDSFVRAQYAGKPCIWQIYPQDEAAHEIKLDAFLALYTANMPTDLAALVTACWHQWNQVDAAMPACDYAAVLGQEYPQWQACARDWREYLLKNTDLATNILSFAGKIS